MIKIKKTIEINKLVIEFDEYSSSPRDWSNLGYFITIDKNYKSPDKYQELEDIIRETGNEATSQEEHIEMIKNRIENETDEKVLKIYPVCKYEHGGINYFLETRQGFDYSNCGFYIITDKTQKELGTDKKDWEKVINQELENYNKWVNGEVYRYTLYDNNGEIDDTCGGFYGLDDVKEYLPAEFQDEDLTQYINN